MQNFLIFYGCLLFYLTSLSTSYNCIHNKIAQSDVPMGKMTYREMRSKRDRHGDLFQNLTIHSYIDDIDESMPKNVIFNIDVALRRVVRFFRETLEVRRTFNPFLLERMNCKKKWKNGVNRGKCSELKSGPELCSLKDTEYVISDRYLHKLEVYDYDDSRPRQVLPTGSGVRDANFILFVISRRTSWCLQEDVQAYGSYCRLDSGYRPVAGLLNLCPSKFSKKLFRASHYFNVIMHEVIHILGFSSHLFSKYKICTTVYDCESPKRIATNDSDGVQRLVFPQLVRSMQLHFNCSDEDFGAPLEQSEGKSDKTNDYSSHWHPLLMYTSIMTPLIGEKSYVVVDNITLALLYSTGWYLVNFNKAENFALGKGQGCKFGFEDECEKSKHLCLPSENATGCDVLEYTIGQCQSVVPYHPCGVYKPDDKESCLDESGRIYALNLRAMRYVQRCVEVQSDDSGTEPTCMVMKCTSKEKVDVLVNSSWVGCSKAEKVKSSNLTVTCPSDLSFCGGNVIYDQIKPTCDSEDSLAIFVRVYFSDPAVMELIDFNNFKNFKVSTLQAIAESINVPINYIVNSTLAAFKKMYLDFAVCPPSNMSNAELGNLIRKTQSFLQSSPFTHIFKGGKEFPAVTRRIMIEPDRAIQFSDYEGFKTLSVIPIICAIFVIATFIASIFRLIIIQRQRPKRKETEELESLQQSNPQQSSQFLMA